MVACWRLLVARGERTCQQATINQQLRFISLPPALMPTRRIAQQHKRADHNMKQSAEWQIGDEYAGQDGVEVPDVSINIGEGRSAEKKPTKR